MKELEEWHYEMAYFTTEDIATPKGVKKFILECLEKRKGGVMGNSKRWREFITWWNDLYPEFQKQGKTAEHIVFVINHRIDAIKQGE